MHGLVTVLFGVACLLVVCGLLPPLAARIRLPYTVLLAAIGVGLGILVELFPYAQPIRPADEFVAALNRLHLTSESFLYIFLPILLFESALSIDVRRLLDDMAPILLLAVVAVLMCTAIVGLALFGLSQVGLVACLLVGAIIATTDPVAVVGVFRDIGAPRRLTLLVEGESLFNDAAAIALFTLLIAMLTGAREASLGNAVLVFVQGFVGGVIVGYVFGRITCAVVAPMHGVPLAEITLTFALAYLAFILGEQSFHVSGVVAVVTAGLVVGSVGRTRVSPETWEALLHVWEQLGFWASSLIFVLASMFVPPILADVSPAEIALLGVVIVATLVARAIVLYGMLPALSAFGGTERVSTAYKAVMLWGGLRGAVSLALALSVAENPSLPEPVQRFVATLAAGFVLFTLFVNGPTLRPLIRWFGLDRLPPAELAIRNGAMALTLSTIRDDVQQFADQYQIEPDMVKAVADRYDARLAEAERTVAGESSPPATDLAYIGLVTLANREERLCRTHFEEGIISRGIVERLIAQTGRMLDGAKASGREGYLAAAAQVVAFPLLMRLGALMQRRLGVAGVLAHTLSVRFEILLVSRMLLRRLAKFNERRIARLLGAATTAQMADILKIRSSMVEQALLALKLQYPDYAGALEQQYLARAALRREEADYRGLYTDQVISREVLADLEHDVASRQRALRQRLPKLDLGLSSFDMVARVPLFARLPRDRLDAIVKLLRPHLALPGEMLVRLGDHGDSMFYISSGAVEVRLPGVPTPVRLGSGDFFGEMALLSRQPRNADVVALGYCQLLVLMARDFNHLLDRHEDLRVSISEVASARHGPVAVE